MKVFQNRDAPANSSRESASEPRGKLTLTCRRSEIAPENQDKKGSLQKTHWYSRASGGKIR